MPELRKDPVLGRWIIIATERAKRPSDFGMEPQEKSNEKLCPFCVGNENKTPPEVLAYREPETKPNTKGWWLRVVPNKFPALEVEGDLSRTGEGMYDKMNGIGAHEIIIENPDHYKTLPELERKNVEDVIWAYRDRTVDLKRDSRFEYILIFKNQGSAAGASLTHSHSQLIALPIVPKRVKEEMVGAQHYYENKERCVFCDVIRQETKSVSRIITENEDFVVFAPFASRFPFETWIIPKKHDSSFEDIQKHEVIHLACCLKGILTRMNKVLNFAPYNYMLHNSPLNTSHLPYYHWHIEVMPILTRVAGFEWGTGFYINPTPPEEAAKFLREAGG